MRLAQSSPPVWDAEILTVQVETLKRIQFGQGEAYLFNAFG
jgi:hypothetical protein